eukprot:GHVL01028680.1.p1 GENE.GHVL01028680.1~~GHVL01028680.1.p1  ORF type:complete len:559 (+),score=79.32 GHVL01028680.1:60-1736(+)
MSNNNETNTQQNISLSGAGVDAREEWILAHTLRLNPNLKFGTHNLAVGLSDNESQDVLAKKVEEQIKHAYWQSILEAMKQNANSVIFDRFTELQTIIIGYISSKVRKAEVVDLVDISLVKQELENSAFNWASFRRLVNAFVIIFEMLESPHQFEQTKSWYEVFSKKLDSDDNFMNSAAALSLTVEALSHLFRKTDILRAEIATFWARQAAVTDIKSRERDAFRKCILSKIISSEDAVSFQLEDDTITSASNLCENEELVNCHDVKTNTLTPACRQFLTKMLIPFKKILLMEVAVEGSQLPEALKLDLVYIRKFQNALQVVLVSAIIAILIHPFLRPVMNERTKLVKDQNSSTSMKSIRVIAESEKSQKVALSVEKLFNSLQDFCGRDLEVVTKSKIIDTVVEGIHSIRNAAISDGSEQELLTSANFDQLENQLSDAVRPNSPLLKLMTSRILAVVETAMISIAKTIDQSALLSTTSSGRSGGCNVPDVMQSGNSTINVPRSGVSLGDRRRYEPSVPLDALGSSPWTIQFPCIMLEEIVSSVGEFCLDHWDVYSSFYTS